MKRFKNILCVVNPESQREPALERSVKLAENNQATLSVVSVTEAMAGDIELPEQGSVSEELQSALIKAQKTKLDELVEPYRKYINIQTTVLSGSIFLEIIREVLRNGRDLVVKTPEDPDWLSQLFGSDDMHLLRKCPCPVWLVKAEAPKKFRRILAAVDVDEFYPPEQLASEDALNHQVLEVAGSLAVSEFSELHVVHAWSAPGESAMRGGFLSKPEEQIKVYVEQVRQQREKALNALLQDAGKKLGADAMDYLKPQTHLVKGWAREEIPELARQLDVDLVVMGTVARTGVPGFIIGNTAENILNQIQCSVLAIKPPGFVTPVVEQS
ncbi:MAG: universal stress protein [Gammaproteobacteria bacterium]